MPIVLCCHDNTCLGLCKQLLSGTNGPWSSLGHEASNYTTTTQLMTPCCQQDSATKLTPRCRILSYFLLSLTSSSEASGLQKGQ